MDELLIERLNRDVEEIARPLADRLAKLESEIADREHELGELKQARTRIRAVVKGLDPSLVVEKEKPKKKPEWLPSAERASALLEFLQAHREELNGNGGFHAAGLTTRFPKELPVAYSTVHKILGMLHEQGSIELHSTGTGGAKFYKVIA